jgi:ribosomal protein S18 acetylase RimI-like enzyme
LEVRASNYSAINLYESIGFMKDAIRPNYYSGNPKEDALLMSLGL